MSNSSFLQWIRHAFKLDPDKYISDEQLNKLVHSGTDVIIVGGTLGVTYEDTLHLLQRIRKFGQTTVIQEISNLESIIQGFDYYFIPLVINAQNPKWIFNAHHEAIKKYADLINWEQVFVEGYIVLNEESSVAKLTECNTDLTEEDVLAYAIMIDKMLGLPILYVEYSGIYGNPTLLKEISESIESSKLFYGGGIHSLESAQEMANYASTIIIGNLIYEDFEQALKTIIK